MHPLKYEKKAMNIVVNAVLSYEQPRGVGRVVNTLLKTLADMDRENQYYVYYGTWMKEYSFLQIKKDNFHFIPLDIKNTQWARNFYLSLILPGKCKKLKPDVFMLIDTQAILRKPCYMVSIIHDLAEFEVPEKYSRKQAFIRRQIVRLQTKLSDKIITISEYSKNDIIKRLRIDPKKIKVIPNGLDAERFQVKEGTPKTDNSFLFVSELERAKGPCTLVEAFHRLTAEEQQKYSLVFAGKKGNDYDRLLQLIEQYGLADRVTIKGYVDDDELNALYEKAYAFVFPSLFEGFGLPVLEAMAKGTPVLCSDRASIPEVGGEAVLTFDPDHPEELSERMHRIIVEKGLRDQMREKGIARAKLFGNDRMARETLRVLTKE